MRNITMMTGRLILNHFTVAILLATFSACESELDTQLKQNYIRFTTDVITTKGSLINQFPEGGTFGVSGYCFVNGASGSADWNSKKAQAKPDIMYNQPITYTAAQGCIYNPPASWSDVITDKYTFFAYYPFNDKGITLSPKTQAGVPTLTYTMPFTSTNTATMLDIKAVPDVMVANSIDHKSGMGQVKFKFNHILTSFDFVVNNFHNNKRVTVHSLKFTGTFNKTAEVNMETGKANMIGEYKGTFEIMNEPKIIFPNWQTGGPQSLINAAGDNYLMLLPQTLSAVDYVNKKWTVTISYWTHETNENKHFIKTFVLGANGSSISYSAGTRYTITFNFNK